MTTEIRQIAFQPSEVCTAIHDYRRRRNEPLPPGMIVGVDFGEGPDITVTLNIRNDTTGNSTNLTLGGESVAAALILFCINRKIPLPAKSQKKVQRIGNSIGLTIKQEVRPR